MSSRKYLDTIHKVYVLTLEKFIKTDEHNFICPTMRGLFLNDVITWDEYEKASEFFKGQRPTSNQHPVFFFHYLFDKDPESTSWWKDGDFYSNDIKQLEIADQRKMFLELLIKITSENHGEANI